MAYLYDVGPLGVAKLVTHGVTSFRTGEQSKTINFDMVASAYSFKKRHRIVLALDTFDFLYAPPVTGLFEIEFSYGAKYKSLLSLPNKL